MALAGSLASPLEGRLGATRGAGTGLRARAETWLALGVCALAPVNVLRLPNLYFTVADALALVLLALLASRGFADRRPGGRFLHERIGLAAISWVFGAILLVVSLLASSLMAAVPERGIVVALQYAQTLLVLPLVILSRPQAERLGLAKAFVASIVVMCLFGAWMVYAGTDHGSFVSGTGRMRSFIERSNEAAMLIAMTVPILMALRRERVIGRPAFVLAGAAMAWGVVMTGSNSGLAALALAVAVSAILALDWRPIVAGALGAAGLAGAIAAFGETILPEAFRERVMGALVTGDLSRAGTFDHRLDLLREASALADTIVFPGIGAGRYEALSAFAQPVHNAYLLLWTEGGLPAFAGLVVVLLVAFGVGASVYARRHGRASPARSGAVALLAVATVFAFAIQTIPYVYGRFWIIPVLVALGLAARGAGGHRPGA